MLQPQDPDQVGNADPEAVEHAVMGAAVPAWAVVHRHRRDPPAAPEKEGGEKAMHMVELGQREEAIPAEQLESGAAVACGVAQKPSADRIGHATGEPLDPRILATAPLAHDETKVRWRVRAPDDGQKTGDVRRVVLAVPIQGRDPGSSRHADAMTLLHNHPSRLEALCLAVPQWDYLR